MKQQYIPLEKRSKREQREHHAAQRGSWGGMNPVTRKPPNPKAYNRKKSGQRYEHEPLPGFYSTFTLSYASLPVSKLMTIPFVALWHKTS